MKSTGIVRRIDDLGRIVIPKEVRRTLNIKENEAMEFYLEGKNIVLRPYRKSFEELCQEWYRNNGWKMNSNNARFIYHGDYTFCIVSLNGQTYYGGAKRYKNDTPNGDIGRTAAYANAIGTHINKLVGYKG